MLMTSPPPQCTVHICAGKEDLMRRTLFVSTLSMVLVVLIAAPALAHVCFVADKTDGAGSAGTATVIIDVAIDSETFEEVDFAEQFIPGPDLAFNPRNERFQGAFVTLTFEVHVWFDEIGEGDPFADVTRTEDVLVQNTVGGLAHFAGPGDDGCDGVGMESLEACILGAVFGG
jgi:hypothetical protein